MSVGVIVHMNLKPGGPEKVVALFKERLAKTRAWEGCENIYLGVDEEDPQHLVLVERWTSREAYDKYREWAMGQPGTEEIMPYIIGGLQTTYVDDTGA